MAIAINDLPIADFISSADLTVYTHGSSYTAAANSTQYALVCVPGTALINPPFSGGGLTWSLLQEVTYNTTGKFYAYEAKVGGSPVSVTPSIDLTGDPGTGCIMSFFEVTGMNPTTPTAQSKDASGSTANPVVSGMSAINTNNGVIAGFACSRNPPGSSGWGTETSDVGHTSPTNGLAAAFVNSGETGTSITFTSAATNWGMIVIEVAAAAGAGPARRVSIIS